MSTANRYSHASPDIMEGYRLSMSEERRSRDYWRERGASARGLFSQIKDAAGPVREHKTMLLRIKELDKIGSSNIHDSEYTI